MQLSGSMTRKFGPSWKQSTGHTSTQSVCLQLMQFSVTTWVTVRRAVGDTHSLAATIAPGHDLDQGVSVAPARTSRSEARRVGKEGVSTVKIRWWPCP